MSLKTRAKRGSRKRELAETINRLLYEVEERLANEELKNRIRSARLAVLGFARARGGRKPEYVSHAIAMIDEVKRGISDPDLVNKLNAARIALGKYA